MENRYFAPMTDVAFQMGKVAGLDGLLADANPFVDKYCGDYNLHKAWEEARKQYYTTAFKVFGD